MKRLIFVMMICLIHYNTKAQARIGSTSSVIQDEFTELGYQPKYQYTEKTGGYIIIYIEKAAVYYYLDAAKICTTTVVVPTNQGTLNYYVELYNKQYVIVSNTEWKMYSKNGICSVKLIYLSDGSYFFRWEAID